MKPRAKYLRGVQQRYCNNELTSLTLLNSGIVRLTLIFMEDGRGWETLVSSRLKALFCSSTVSAVLASTIMPTFRDWQSGLQPPASTSLDMSSEKRSWRIELSTPPATPWLPFGLSSVLRSSFWLLILSRAKSSHGV